MKKTYPVSNNAKSPCTWHKHLEKDDQRRVNKSTRKILKEECEEIVKYIKGDTCPECSQILDFDDGTPETRNDPGQPAAIFCPDCGLEYDVDWNKMLDK